MDSDAYPVEAFTEAEATLLAPHVTNLDRPVFALVGLPETTKGMLFARYSRYQGTLRRLMLDEFSDALSGADATARGEGEHAAEVAGRVIGQFGDDSVCQLASVHVACEWSSNILTKILQRPRIGAAYLEQSTRYIAFDQPMEGTGRFRYLRRPELGPAYEACMDSLFTDYSRLLAEMTDWVAERFPHSEGEPEAAWKRAVRAKALDACRGLLPAASLSHMGICANAQALEQLLLHLLSHPLPEAREYGVLLQGELESVIPSFLSRVSRADRGGEWMEYLGWRRDAGREVAERLGLTSRAAPAGPSVTLLEHRGSEEDLLSALVFEDQGLSEGQIRQAILSLEPEERASCLATLLSHREPNRRHRPGRGLEALSYRFEVVSDYGAFRDLQRHRMLTCQWQGLTPDLGADAPEEIRAAGFEDDYRRALDRSAACYEELRDRCGLQAASYALCLAFRIRYVLDLNAREAMQLTELRSGPQGHHSYRTVAQQMHELIGAVHPVVAQSMVHVDHSASMSLGRLGAEARQERRSQGEAPAAPTS
jgi:thymidylate synthase ThyX